MAKVAILGVGKMGAAMARELAVANHEVILWNRTNEKAIELRSLALFQQIDSLGNYSNPNWFLSLTKPKLIGFIRNLIDVWSYRAQLTIEAKRNICPPNGDPFRNLNIQYINAEQNVLNINTSKYLYF